MTYSICVTEDPLKQSIVTSNYCSNSGALLYLDPMCHTSYKYKFYYFEIEKDLNASSNDIHLSIGVNTDNESYSNFLLLSPKSSLW